MASMASKTFVNNSDHQLYVTLYIRPLGGSLSLDGATTETFFIDPDGVPKTVSYSSAIQGQLNAIEFSWADNGTTLAKKEKINAINCWLDNTLNDNSIITFNAVGRADITGSN